MEWTLYLTDTRPNPLMGVLDFMRIGNEHIVQLLLAGIMGVISLGVAHIKELTVKVENIGATLQQTRMEGMFKDEQQDIVMKDFGVRLRRMEQRK